ncbi:uncharacterized protein LACBIDRAFT_324030 [Laccaria bicolor S238N-H82]|uniref:Predicted protein n=1 Tax=Laccaria bicolor (strain S238N-H82 / ATCC MYA-4686) TaxID=486041 RepID=B0D0F6_LACBS|nr:uncharacterized protein LACBIDRAFT_324030 [Laccaria bicolor S238N-H82]EDR11448.1 predicted protein [Laccaria bicolor S238N-H82]|eukprot:XP_001877345.1 predicted protein [Laccaria bicolor S238N-H82]
MATLKKAAESTLYHLSPKGDVVVVNPEISSGLPLPNLNRWPPPASRPEKYSTPATKASDPAENPYWKRDVRRAYPQLSVVTQSELSSLLIAHSSPPQVYVSTNVHHIRLLTPLSSAAPVEGQTEVPVVAQKTPELSEAIATITGATKVYSESKLPPALPIPYKRWVPQLSPNAPHDQFAYFPMSLYR